MVAQTIRAPSTRERSLSMSRLTSSLSASVAGVTLPQARLVTCSICLSVRSGDEWIGAEQAIQELRSFTLGEPPPLAPGLCDDCRSELSARRGDAVRAAA
jgi:hypothetical protein